MKKYIISLCMKVYVFQNSLELEPLNFIKYPYRPMVNIHVSCYLSIYLGGPNCYEFTYDYYNDNNDAFGLLFQQNTDSSVENFYHPTFVNEWKSNM